MIDLSVILELNMLPERSPLNEEFNCFGASALVLGFIDKLESVNHLRMQNFVDQFMEEVPESSKEPNDLYALYDSIGLLHTAIFLGDKYWQKPGKWTAEFTDKNKIDNVHIKRQGVNIEGTYTKIYRLKRKNK